MKLKQNPSERIHRRYILISNASKEETEKAILGGIGVLGWAKSAPLFLEAKNRKNIVLAVRRESLNEVRACFEISNFKGRIERVSGTIKGVKETFN